MTFKTLISITAITGWAMCLALIITKEPKDDFQAWKNCIETSPGSDADCEACDEQFNPSRHFKLN